MAIKSVVYNRDLITQAKKALKMINDSFEAMAHVIDVPDHAPASKWFGASSDYQDAVEELEGIVGCLIEPGDLQDPDDLAVTEILKSLEEATKEVTKKGELDV